MEKRLLTALALSLVILFAFQKFNPSKTVAPTKTQENVAAPLGASSDAYLRESALPTEKQKGQTPAVYEKAKEVIIETDKYYLTFSSLGGSLRKIVLKEYSKNGTEEVLQETKDPLKSPFAIKSGLFPGLGTRVYQENKGTGYLEYTYTEPGQIEIKKRYTFGKSFDYIVLSISVKNLTSRELLFAYEIMGPSGMVNSDQVSGRSFLQAASLVDGQIWKKKPPKQAEGKSGMVEWVGLKNRYFTMILNPEENAQTVMLKPAGPKDLMIELTMKPLELRAGSSKEATVVMYAGPLLEDRVSAAGENLGGIIDYGFFGPVSKVLLTALNFFFKWTKNWGVAIILLTLAINLILFPLTKKSFTSMQRMKMVQPHMQQLKEKHKDNPQKLNKEMMELYKKYNVNPLGGCLPMLLQMPIFISLYQGLMRSVSLKGAHFLWIKDLAKPDAVPLPFTLPLIGAAINILPLLMVGAMFLQQKISQGTTAAVTDEQASQQKMMTYIFPLFFGFLFYKMPSGLVLYWLTNTVLMVTEQSMIAKKHQQII